VLTEQSAQTEPFFIEPFYGALFTEPPLLRSPRLRSPLLVTWPTRFFKLHKNCPCPSHRRGLRLRHLTVSARNAGGAFLRSLGRKAFLFAGLSAESFPRSFRGAFAEPSVFRGHSVFRGAFVKIPAEPPENRQSFGGSSASRRASPN
jgi:hypothetical protein